MRTLAIRRGILLSLGLAAALSMAACAATKPPNSAGPGPSHTVPPAASPTPTRAASPPAPTPSATPPSSSLTVTPAALPADKVEAWVAHTPAPVVMTTMGHNVYLNECATVAGATTWQQLAYDSRIGDVAIMETYSFTSAAAASAAYTGVLAGMNQCQSTSRARQTANHILADAVCAQTAHSADGAAFERTWTSVPGFSAGGPEINHLYVVVRGTTILVLHFDQTSRGSGTAAIYNVRNDPAVLTMLTGALAAQNRVISSTERSALTAAFVAYKGISITDVLGGGPVQGSVYYAYDPATDTYWAAAYFMPSSAASPSALGALDNGGRIAMYRKAGAGVWQVQTASTSLTCEAPHFFPQAVLVAWSLPTAPYCRF